MSELSVDPGAAAVIPMTDAGHDWGTSSDSLVTLVDREVDPAFDVALRAVREMLGMEVAYMTQTVGDEMFLRHLEGDGESFRLATGGSMPTEHTYCQRMLDGRLPNLIPDVRADARTASLPITALGNVGAVATVPLRFADGRLYGTLCAASHDATALDHRQLGVLKVFARLIADRLERQETDMAMSRLASLVNAAADAIMGLTPAGVVISWNAACERIFGYPAGEAIGRSIVDLIALPGREAGMRETLATASGGEVVRRVGRRRRADGAIIHDAVTLSPIRDAHGDVHFISSVTRDVTDEVLQAHYRMVEQQVMSSLDASTDSAQAALGALRCVAEGLDCEIAVLWERDATGQALRCSSLWAAETATAAAVAEQMRTDSFVRGEELPGRIWATGRPVWTERLDRVTDSERSATAAAAGLCTVVAQPLRMAGEVVGVVELISCHQAVENADLLAWSAALTGRLADSLARHRAQEALRAANHALEIRVRERTTDLEHIVAELDAAQIETVRRLSRAVEFRDQDTGAHTARVGAFAARTARRAGLDAERCRLIERASPLHDVGKVAIPDSVLLKPGPLTAAERAVIETHAEIGHRLLEGSDSAVLRLAATIALTHHEHYDGGGYPRALVGESIPVEGRIVAIADVFDALTSDRTYRPAMTFRQALAVLHAGRGTQFDPVLLDHFLADLDEIGMASLQ
jgi:PAS domain S-box-containing protein